MRFDSNRSIIDKCDSQRTNFVLLFVLSIILFFLILILLAAGVLDTIDDGYHCVLIWLLFIASGVTTITSLIGIVKFGKLTSQLEESYLRIDDTTVTGFGYLDGRETGSSFCIRIDKIMSAQHNGLSDGYNFMLNTASGTYKCLAIADAPKAVQTINQAIADYKNKESNAAQTAESENGSRKCIFCGADMSKDQQFCGACGRRQD